MAPTKARYKASSGSRRLLHCVVMGQARAGWAVVAVIFSGMLACFSAGRPSRMVTQNTPSMRRIMSEWKQVQAEGLAMGDGSYSVRGNSTDTFRLKPVGNMFEWHFTFLGARDSPFEGGLYHGSITLPADYPQSGPAVRLLTHNQRFKVGSRICLSASEYHQETWHFVCPLRVRALGAVVRHITHILWCHADAGLIETG